MKEAPDSSVSEEIADIFPNYNIDIMGIPCCHMKSYTAGFSNNMIKYIDGLVQERHNAIANALELHLSCTNPLNDQIYRWVSTRKT